MAKQEIIIEGAGAFRTKLNDNFTELYNTSYKTVKYSVGGVGVANCDLNFTTAINNTKQSIDLGNIVPALSRILDVFVITNNTFTGTISLGVEVGTTSGGNEIITTSDLITAGAINQIASGTLPKIDIVNTATHIFLSGTPGALWNLNIEGKLTIYISYLDITNV